MKKLIYLLILVLPTISYAQEELISYVLPLNLHGKTIVYQEAQETNTGGDGLNTYLQRFSYNGASYKLIFVVQLDFGENIWSEIDEFTSKGFIHRTLFTDCSSYKKLHTLTKLKVLKKNIKELVTLTYLDGVKIGVYIRTTSEYGDLTPFIENDYEYLKGIKLCY